MTEPLCVLPAHRFPVDGGPSYFVYRAYSATGDLLYVGCTGAPWNRMAAHRRSPWWREAERIEWSKPMFYDAATKAETEAIWTESPVYNQPSSFFVKWSLA